MQLPIEKILPELRVTLLHHCNVVLTADPGAGKTTRVPLALLNEPWLLNNKIIMLEPRRLAAQRSAIFMAEQIGERVGETVGYRMRGENKTGTGTKIEVVTEGILTRMLQNDPTLSGVAMVIFDEFHERSIHADLGLALAIDIQQKLRSDLRILVMSATLNGVAVSALLNNAPVIASEGKMFPVETRYLSQHYNGSIESLIVSTILRSLRNDFGDILVFLPGQREIKKTESLLHESALPENVDIHLLYGEAPYSKQRAVLIPSVNGRRKVILSTSVAETSLTIDGVRVVIDSGLSRVSKFDPRRGMSGLVTVPVSQASAEQRKGRAGRQQPGVCYRLWTEQEHTLLPKFSQPEIVSADLALFALELAMWGDSEGKSLKFLDSPPASHFSQAKSLLKDLTLVDGDGRLTTHGIEASKLGVHPRLAHMLIKGKELGMGALACEVAALLEERDFLRNKNEFDIDFIERWKALQEGNSIDRFIKERITQQANRLKILIDATTEKYSSEHIGILLALAYPERIAKQRFPHSEKYQLSGNTVGILPKESALFREEFLAVADVDGAGSEVKIFLAAPLTKSEILEAFQEQIVEEMDIRWDEKTEGIVSRKVTRLGAIELAERNIEPLPEQTVPIIIEVLRTLGIDELPWNKESTSLRLRSEWLRTRNLAPANWPNLSAANLIATFEQWLAPYLSGITKKTHLQKLDLTAILRSMFSYQQLQELEYLAPSYLKVPSGSRIAIDYSVGEQPVLSVRLQEMFGAREAPAIAGGKVKVQLHLLSPAHRPLAVTQDLNSFWKNVYPEVRKDMRGQYPKHSWPEDPLSAAPTRKTTKSKR